MVELIVVILILAVLTTIAFLSYSKRTVSARDSQRSADLKLMEKGLEAYNATS